MSWDQKKIFIVGLVDSGVTVRKYVQDSRRSASLKYFLKIDNQRKQVCKAFFLSIFGLNEGMVNKWITSSTDGVIPAKNIKKLETSNLKT